MSYEFKDWEIDENGQLSILADSPPPRKYNQAIEIPLFDDLQIVMLTELSRTGLVAIAEVVRCITNPITNKTEGQYFRMLTHTWFKPILIWMLKVTIRKSGEECLERAQRYCGFYRENECGERITVTKKNLYRESNV